MEKEKWHSCEIKQYFQCLKNTRKVVQIGQACIPSQIIWHFSSQVTFAGAKERKIFENHRSAGLSSACNRRHLVVLWSTQQKLQSWNFHLLWPLLCFFFVKWHLHSSNFSTCLHSFCGIITTSFWQENLNLARSVWGWQRFWQRKFSQVCKIHWPEPKVPAAARMAMLRGIMMFQQVIADFTTYYVIAPCWWHHSRETQTCFEKCCLRDRWSLPWIRGTVIYATFQPIHPNTKLSTCNSINGHIVLWVLSGNPAEPSSFAKCSPGKPLIDPRPCGNRYQRWVGSCYEL